ncbi:MAG: hypothetical protein ACOY46_18805 [Bacillota bacterium]
MKEPLVIALVLVLIVEILLVYLLSFLRKKVSSNIKYHLEILFSWYFEIITTVIKILVIINLIFVIYRLLNLWPISNVSTISKDILQDKDVLKVIVGAFLASGLGILTQIFLRRLNLKKDVRKYSMLLRNEIENLLLHLSSAEHSTKVFKSKEEPSKIFEGHLLEELSYDPKWREYYACLSDELPFSYYTIISNIYKSVDQFNKAIKEKDFDGLFYSFWKVRRRENTIPIMGMPTNTNKDLLNILDALSRNKRIKTKRFCNLCKEILYNRLKKAIFLKVEEEAIKLLNGSSKNRLERSILEERIMTWYNDQSQKFKKKYNPIINRIIFEVLLESSNIDLVWGECFLKNN